MGQLRILPHICVWGFFFLFWSFLVLFWFFFLLTALYHYSSPLCHPFQPWAVPCCWLGPQTGKTTSPVKPTCLQTNWLGRKGAALACLEAEQRDKPPGRSHSSQPEPSPSHWPSRPASTAFQLGGRCSPSLSTDNRRWSEAVKEITTVCMLIHWHLLHFPEKSYHPAKIH